jgi:hypothetical protein
MRWRDAQRVASRDTTNPKHEIPLTETCRVVAFGTFEVFEVSNFVSDFVLRISDLVAAVTAS